jgi:hypothetical protein
MEAFQRNALIGWIMQRMGAYSIIRGTADRQSFQMTKKILTEGKRWLVIFPEGQTVWQNDTVIPFQEGVTQMAFKALESIDQSSEDDSLRCIPIAIKYAYINDMSSEIEESLKRLESQFFVDSPPALTSSYERLRRIGEAMLRINEQKHGIKPDKEKSLDHRIQSMKEIVVREIEQKLDITPRADQLLIDRIRSCFNAVDCIICQDAPATPYEQKLFNERNQSVSLLYDDLWRVLQLVAIYDGYVGEELSVERFMDVLCLLEMETFNERQMWGPRKAVIKIGKPLDLKERLTDYKENKRSVIRQTSLDLETSVKTMLAELAEKHGTPFKQHKRPLVKT